MQKSIAFNFVSIEDCGQRVKRRRRGRKKKSLALRMNIIELTVMDSPYGDEWNMIFYTCATSFHDAHRLLYPYQNFFEYLTLEFSLFIFSPQTTNFMGLSLEH